MADLDLDTINAGIADRSDVFYWQADRAVDRKQAGEIWADRHRYFSDDELLERINNVLGDDKLVSIEPFDLDAQTSLGSVNSVRAGKLASGREVIVRCHPKGIRNGYFHAESTAAQTALAAGLPSYNTLVIHDYEGGDDFAFQVIEKLPGSAIKKWLVTHPEDESALLLQIGTSMAKLHQVSVSGFGPFSNEQAEQGKLVGLHQTLGESVRAGLPTNLNVLQEAGLLTAAQAAAITKLFSDDSPLLQRTDAVLVHNDFADWNLLTDGHDITGILDWDECVGSDPISDIACWSTFFNPERLPAFLDGYFSIAEKPSDFQARFELLRFRYVISKMTLRLHRYSWRPTPDVKVRIDAGTIHLRESLDYFGF